MRTRLTVLALISSIAAAGCAKDPNAPDATTPVTGRWLASDTVEVFTGFDVQMTQNPQGVIRGAWVGKTRITNGKCDATFGCAPSNVVFGNNLSLQVNIEILGAGSFNGQLVTKSSIEGQINRYGTLYRLRLTKVE